MFVCFLESLLMQLHADLCADSPGCLNLMTETVIYRKLLNEASVKLSKTLKLTAVIISFYLTSVCCQFTSSTIFLQSSLQLSIILVSLSVQLVVKLEFDSLILSICHSQFKESVTVRNQVFKSSKSIICNMTSVLLVFCSEFLAINFKQFMFNFFQSLSLDEILIASELQKDDIVCQISTYFIIITV